MRALDFGSALASAATAVKEVFAPKKRVADRDAEDELRRRAEINAESARRRGELQAAIFGGGPRQWIAPRPGWLAPRRRERWRW